MGLITSISQISSSVKIETVVIDGVGEFMIRELSDAAVSELQRRAPDVIVDGDVKTVRSSTGSAAAAFIVSRSWCDDDGKLLYGGTKGEAELSRVSHRILAPLSKAALRLSGLLDSEDEAAEKKEDS